MKRENCKKITKLASFKPQKQHFNHKHHNLTTTSSFIALHTHFSFLIFGFLS